MAERASARVVPGRGMNLEVPLASPARDTCAHKQDQLSSSDQHIEQTLALPYMWSAGGYLSVQYRRVNIIYPALHCLRRFTPNR